MHGMFLYSHRTVDMRNVSTVVMQEQCECGKIYRKILTDEKPDVIHFFGTEFLYTSYFIKIASEEGYKDRIVTSIQGLVSVYYDHYSAGLPDYIMRRKTLSEIKGKCSLIGNKKNYLHRGKYEQEALVGSSNIMFDLLEGKEQHCEFDGVETVLKTDGRYCCVPVTHKVTLGEIVDLLQEFKAQPSTLMMPKMPDGSFAKKLYSLYLTYLPTDRFKYALKMNVDNRGSFTELVHTADCGQVSINISRPGITKGQHWHNSKWELFIVVKAVAEALGDTGRILVRESGTEPVVRVMVEAPDHDTCQKYVDEVVNVICEKGYKLAN